MSGFGVDRGSNSTNSGAADSAIGVSTIDAKGDLIVGTAADTATRLAVGTDGQRLIADSAQTEGVRWASDTENTVADAKGDLLVGTAADTVAKLTVGANETRLVADSAQATGLKYVADTTNYAIAAKGDLLVGTAADTVAALTVGSDDTVPIADSAQSSGIRWGTVPSATTRQTQLAGPVDSSGYNATLSAGAGLNFNVDATPTNVVFTFANGFGSGGSVDTYTQLTADASNQGSLNASNTHYIHATRVSSSSVTWGQALVPPQYGYAFDRTQGALLNFEAADASTTMVDDFGNTWTAAGNAQIDTAQSKFGTSSLLLDGTGDYIENTSITTLGDGAWEISFWFRLNALLGVGTGFTLVKLANASAFGFTVRLLNTGGTTKLQFYLSSDGTSWDQVNAENGTNTTWALNQWNKIRVVFDPLTNTYKAYLSLNGAAETTDWSHSTSSRMCAITKFRIGADESGGESVNGWIDAFRFVRCATNTSAETPSASAPAITDYPYHFFSIPAMTMYEVTAASASAGVNPTLTQRNRVFVGEADTGAATVSAVRNYALRGEYVSADTTIPASGTRQSFSHNIGVRPQIARMVLVNQTADKSYVPGDTAPVIQMGDAATGSFALDAARNTAGATFATGIPIVSKGAATFTNITTASWKYRLETQRGW